MENVKKIGDVLNSKEFLGNKIDFISLLNKSFIINDFEIRKSKFDDRNFAIISGKDMETNEDFVTFTTSTVVIDKLNKIKEHLPVAAKLVKKKRYFDLVNP